jgi:hypothetical protein
MREARYTDHPRGEAPSVAQWEAGEDVWLDTWLEMPEERPGREYRNIFTGEELSLGVREGVPGLFMASVFTSFPLGLLEACK